MPNDAVIVAMSGGVDSSVAAWLLREAGCAVRGVFLRMSGDGPSPDAAILAGQQLGMELDVLDCTGRFEQVLDYFAGEYARGRTPNPCARCNPLVKFASLVEHADSLGAAWIATGHHARIACVEGRPAILRGRYRPKDQSYVLFDLARTMLARLRLPIGEMADKAEVRRLAGRLGLSAAQRADSQDICFLPHGNYASVLMQRAPQALRPGLIVDADGRELGRHEGVGHFTVGQRRGLRVAMGVPMHVIGIDAASATVIIGPRQATLSRRLTAGAANWHADEPAGPLRAEVQIRYNHAAVPAEVRPLGEGRFEAVFDEPVHAVAPGQVAAVYDGDRLLGGGWIEQAWEV